MTPDPTTPRAPSGGRGGGAVKRNIPNSRAYKVSGNSGNSGNLHWEGSEAAPYMRGVVSTPFGYVYVYAQPGKMAYYDLSVIVEGYNYTRAGRGCPPLRTLVVMAGRFAREVTEAEDT